MQSFAAPAPIPGVPHWSEPREGEAHRTYQERRLGVRTRPELRPPAHLLASDLGLHGVSPYETDAPGLPPGVRFVQIVDAHQGDQASESWLLQQGFGAARSWHYTALGQPEYFLDGEGNSVHRWLRLFSRGPTRGTLVIWRG